MKALVPPSSDMVWTRVHGGQVQVPLDDYVGRAAFLFGDLDPKITWVMRRLLKPGGCALDIGANFGVVTLGMSQLVGERGIVHAFEPNPIICKSLELACLRSHITNVTLHRMALGASTAEMDLYVPEDNWGAASLVRRIPRPSRVHRVKVERLDDVLGRQRLGRIDFMKLDVEGFEFEVLKGARQILQNQRPAAILFEANEPVARGKIAPVMQLLSENDYDFISIPRKFVRMSTRIIDLNDPSRCGHGHDIVAAPRGRAFAAVCGLLRAH
jgi:FkbM family methyltransferase